MDLDNLEVVDIDQLPEPELGVTIKGDEASDSEGKSMGNSNSNLSQSEIEGLEEIMGNFDRDEEDKNKDKDKEKSKPPWVKDKEDKEDKEDGSSKPDATEEPKPKNDSKEPSSLLWIRAAIDEVLQDIIPERRVDIEDKVWPKLLSRRIGDGEQSDQTKADITQVIADVISGRDADDDSVAPSPVDLDTLESGDVVRYKGSNGDYLGRLVSRNRRKAVVRREDGLTESINTSRIRSRGKDLMDDIEHRISEDPDDIEGLIDEMLG